MAAGRRIVVLFVMLLALAVSDRAAALDCPNTLKVAVLGDGSIIVAGTKATLDALDARLTDLAKSKGSVWYYRENAGGEPGAAQSAAIKGVLELIIKHRRPVSFSSTPDYSDVIDGDGNSSPRTKC